MHKNTVSRFGEDTMIRTEKRLLFLLLLLLFLIPGKAAFAEKGRWVQLGKEWTYADEFGNVIPGWWSIRETGITSLPAESAWPQAGFSITKNGIF